VKPLNSGVVHRRAGVALGPRGLQQGRVLTDKVCPRLCIKVAWNDIAQIAVLLYAIEVLTLHDSWDRHQPQLDFQRLLGGTLREEAEGVFADSSGDHSL
jgi:hypothetical protein